jgi:DNA-binding CsgD family transcriptional regulator
VKTEFEFQDRATECGPNLLARERRIGGRGRAHRRKNHSAWLEADRASGGAYGREIDEIARRYPALTLMEQRVCVLVKAMLPSWRIAELLCISEKTVENHRINARKKIGCGCYESMRNALLVIPLP